MERAGAPTFEVIVELLSRQRWRIVRNVGSAVDAMLANNRPLVEERWADCGKFYAKFFKMPHDATE